jgi:hypothetical protein
MPMGSNVAVARQKAGSLKPWTREHLLIASAAYRVRERLRNLANGPLDLALQRELIKCATELSRALKARVHRGRAEVAK